MSTGHGFSLAASQAVGNGLGRSHCRCFMGLQHDLKAGHIGDGIAAGGTGNGGDGGNIGIFLHGGRDKIRSRGASSV